MAIIGPKTRKTTKKALIGSLLRAERVYDGTKHRLMRGLGMRKPTRVLPYRGFASNGRALINGRVFANDAPGGPREEDNWIANLRNTMARWYTREVPGEEVEAEFQGRVYRSFTDHEGYFYFDMEYDERLCNDRLWHSVWFSLPQRGNGLSGASIGARGFAISPPERAQYGVISDLDDTVIYSNITDFVTAARLTFLNNARTRKPFEGVARLYQAFQRGTVEQKSACNPIFYVSSSAWNLYDLMEDFLMLNEIPVGPIMLQDLGLTRNRFINSGHDHKLEKARRIMDLYDHLPFILVGDSGQEDARLYYEAAVEYGDQIKVIFIRDVKPGIDDPKEERVRAYAAKCEALGVPMILVRDSLEAAQYAADMGLITGRAVDAVRSERDKDIERPEGASGE